MPLCLRKARLHTRYIASCLLLLGLLPFILSMFNTKYNSPELHYEYIKDDVITKEIQNIRYTTTHRSVCPNVSLPKEITEDKWQPVGYSLDVHVYSAHVVDSKIRIIGARADRNSLHCQIWYSKKEGLDLYIVPAKITHIPEGHGNKYASSYFDCTIPDYTTPFAVSLVPEQCSQPKNIIKIDTSPKSKLQFNFTVCVKPLHFNYSKAYQLVEFIELNRLLGANKFIFYNHSTRWNVDKVLQYYSKQNIVEIMQWHIPMRSYQWPPNGLPVEIHAYGQLASQNDCLYRYGKYSKYLVFYDVDEFIIPRKHKTWNKMMNSMPANVGEYNFQNTFFRIDWPDTDASFQGKDIAKRFKLYSFLKLVREVEIFPHQTRSKYFVNPNFVETVGIHYSWKFKNGGKRYRVPFHTGLLQHYRDWERPNDTVARAEDKTILKYQKVLENIKKTWGNLPNVALGPFPINDNI